MSENKQKLVPPPLRPAEKLATSSPAPPSAFPNASLDVLNLSYEVNQPYMKDVTDYIRSHGPKNVGTNVKAFGDAANIHCVSFHARSGNVTAIMSPDQAERRTVTDLLGERRRYGSFDGTIAINGVNPNAPYTENIAFVSRKSLYMPGLTYREMLLYATRLRVENDVLFLSSTSSMDAATFIENRVSDVMSIMDLTKIRHRRIDERPVLRGEMGGDLRRLSIAMEIVSLPPVIILDDPLFGMDPAVAVHIYSRLQELARRGHVVITSLASPPPQVFKQIDALVLMSNGYSIYSGAARSLEAFFCSKDVGYKFDSLLESYAGGVEGDSSMSQFVIDIATGAERPTAKREGYTALELQELFESSSAFDRPSLQATAHVAANGRSTTDWYGYRQGFSAKAVFRHTLTVLVRALHVKFQEFEVIKKSIGVAVLLGTLIGVLMRNNGDIGYYCLSFFGIPYAQTSNLTGCLFFCSSIMFIQQILNIHIISQKLQIFRYEQRTRVCPALSFYTATLLAELPFAFFYGMLFINIVYFLVDLNLSVGNWAFFVEVLMVTVIVAFLAATSFASVFRREFVVRDLYLITVFLMVLFSGFPFQFSGMANDFQMIATANPLRWAFEALMVWKFEGYVDGEAFLTPYDFQEFEKGHVFGILANFIIVGAAFLFWSLLPPVNYLKRKADGGVQTQHSRESSRLSGEVSNDLGTSPVRLTTSIQPVIFSRESSMGGGLLKSTLSITVSESGEQVTQKGPTVTVDSLTYRIKDIASPTGERTLLHKINAQFDWGKLSMILGPTGSGKSSLLYALAGETGFIGNVKGTVEYNGQTPSASQLPWQRCAFVEFTDEHFRDLNVQEVVTYAMKLRCLNRKGLVVVEENVNRTLTLLGLDGVRDKKISDLSPGNLRLLSIAEEIVHGPSLLLIDEPTTGLGIVDVSLMLRTFREMVNQDKTVIATMYKPSAAAFNVFDTLMLLSHGRVVYHGGVDNARQFFEQSPFAFRMEGYSNPADYLLDISAQLLPDESGNTITSIELALYFERITEFNKSNNSQQSKGALMRENPLHAAAQASASATAAPPPPGVERITRALSAQSKSEFALNHGMEAAPGARLADSSTSFDVVEPSESSLAYGEGQGAITSKPSFAYFYLNTAGVVIYDYFQSLLNMDVEMYLYKSYLLVERSSMAILKREKLVFASFMLYIVGAVLLGFILGNTNRVTSSKTVVLPTGPTTLTTTTYEYNTTAFFAISLLILVFANVQLIFYWIKTNEVFYKEHSRGLYSNVQQWFSASPALYLMRIANTCVYAAICYDMLMMRQHSDIEFFYFMSLTVAVVAGTMLCETLVVLSYDLRSAYIIIPAVIFLNFAFSGIFVKTPTLPDYATWLPTISLFRWTVQSQVINLFNNDPSLPCVDIFDFCAYNGFLALFGWNDISKWECFWIIVVNVVVYRAILMIALVFRTFHQKGRRQFRKREGEEFAHMYS